MTQPSVKKILSAPLTLVRESTDQEKSLFSDMQAGWLYTFGLSSGQSFVAHIEEKEDVFTFRPLNNLLPRLQQIEWRGRNSVSDLGYDVSIWLDERQTPNEVSSPDEIAEYEEVLRSKPISSENFPLMKIAFKYYTHAPMLKRAIDLKQHIQKYVALRAMLLKAQKKLKGGLIPGKGSQIPQKIVQQKLEERR